MALIFTKFISELDEGLILTPERYNPNRNVPIQYGERSMFVKDVVYLAKESITPKKAGENKFLIINTSNAFKGNLILPKNKEKIGSTKKLVKNGDIIISRLRPYLQQIAAICEDNPKDLALSTEFYVLRSRNKESVLYLIPYLFSDLIQKALNNSVEGNQHPRFDEDSLLNLPIPTSFYDNRFEINEKISNYISMYKFSITLFEESINLVDNLQNT